VQEQKQKGRPVNESELREFLERALRALREYQSEVQKQRRRQQPRHHARPVDFVVEIVQLPAVVEAVEDERHQAENVKVNGARRIPAANEDKDSDEEIDQPDDAKVIFRGERFGGRGNDHRRLKRFAAALHLVAQLAPESGPPNPLGDLYRARDLLSPDFEQPVALPDARLPGGSARRYLPGFDPAVRVPPRHSIVGRFKPRPLVEVQNGEDHRSQRR